MQDNVEQHQVGEFLTGCGGVVARSHDDPEPMHRPPRLRRCDRRRFVPAGEPLQTRPQVVDFIVDPLATAQRVHPAGDGGRFPG